MHGSQRNGCPRTACSDPMSPARRGRDRIPTDENGHVPRSALIARFLERGDRADLGTTDTKVLRGDLVPEDVREWWDDPSVCDIEGIDTADPEVFRVPPSIRGRKRRALSQIAVLSDRKESDRIKRTLAKHFTADELELIADGKLMVDTRPYIDDSTGVYFCRQPGISVPTIVLEQGTSEDGIVHEAVHALRDRQGRSRFPTKGGALDPAYDGLSEEEKRRIVDREEKETVVETVARTRPDRKISGYYADVPGIRSKRSAYLHDQMVVSRSKALKGKEAVKAAEQNFDRTVISRAIIFSNRKMGK